MHVRGLVKKTLVLNTSYIHKYVNPTLALDLIFLCIIFLVRELKEKAITTSPKKKRKKHREKHFCAQLMCGDEDSISF